MSQQISATISDPVRVDADSDPKPTQREVAWFESRLERGRRERFTEVRVLVTPGLASLFMRLNIGNRPINATRIAVHADRLQRGDFRLTHQGVSVADIGVLNDGQHRFLAIMQTGIAGEMQVTFGADRAEFPVIDQAAPRSAADTLGILGENRTKLRAAVARTLLQVKEGKARTFDKQLVADHAMELRGAAMDEAIRIATALRSITAPTAIAVAHYWITKHTKKPHYNVGSFWEGLRDGENLSGVKLRFRNWLITGSTKDARDNRIGDLTVWRAGVTCNAWNAFASNKRTFSTEWKHVTKLPDVR